MSISSGAGTPLSGQPAHPRRGPADRRQHRQAARVAEAIFENSSESPNRPTLLPSKTRSRHTLVIFPDQHLSQDQHLDFAKTFGPLETTIALFREDAKLRRAQGVRHVSNLDPDNEFAARTRGNACFSSATDCGTPIAHSSGCRRWRPALCTLDPTDWRPHRICRRTRRLRCAARRHEAPAPRPCC